MYAVYIEDDNLNRQNQSWKAMSMLAAFLRT